MLVFESLLSDDYRAISGVESLKIQNNKNSPRSDKTSDAVNKTQECVAENFSCKNTGK